MRVRNVQPNGARATAVQLGRTAGLRATGTVTVKDGNGNDVIGASQLLFSGASVTEDEEGGAIITLSGAALGQPWLYAQADGGLVGDGLTDDTTALQALIDTATANGTQSGWIWFEPGVYIIGGALQDTGDFNAQILLPASATGGTLTLTLQGPARPPQGGGQTPSGVAVLKSTLTGASGTAAVFSAGNTSASLYQFVLKDLLCAAPANPTMTFWNLLQGRDGHFEGLLIDAGPTGFATQPTHSNSYGIKLPETSTSGRIDAQIVVQGFYTGIRHAELTWGDYVAWDCYRAVEIVFSYHVGGSILLATLSCAYGIVVTGANQLDIVYDAEHYSAAANAAAPTSYPTWSANVKDLSDASNLLSGHLRWWGVAAFTGIDHVFEVDGAANVHYEEMGELPEAGSVNGVTITGTPSAGSIPVATSSTAASWSASAAVGEILISDTPSTPLVFADLLQNDDQTDLLYADL